MVEVRRKGFSLEVWPTALNLLVMKQENAVERGRKVQNESKAVWPENSEPALSSNQVAGKIITSEAKYKAEAGLPPDVTVMVTGRTIFSPVKENAGTTAVRFEDPEHILASGFMWGSNRKQLAYKPFVVVKHEGRGNIVAFTADPNFRGYMDGLNLLFLNAVFRGPAHVSASSY